MLAPGRHDHAAFARRPKFSSPTGQAHPLTLVVRQCDDPMGAHDSICLWRDSLQGSRTPRGRTGERWGWGWGWGWGRGQGVGSGGGVAQPDDRGKFPQNMSRPSFPIHLHLGESGTIVGSSPLEPLRPARAPPWRMCNALDHPNCRRGRAAPFAQSSRSRAPRRADGRAARIHPRCSALRTRRSRDVVTVGLNAKGRSCSRNEARTIAQRRPPHPV